MPFNRRPKKLYDEAALYEYALGALGRKMRTVAELKRLMRAKVGNGTAELAMLERVVAKLKEYKYLNDSHYAAAYIRNRQENEKFGRRRVQQDLALKGIHAEVIEKTLSAAY